MTDKGSSLDIYRRVCSMRSCLELRDERGLCFTKAQTEKLNSLISQWFEVVDRRSGRHVS